MLCAFNKTRWSAALVPGLMAISGTPVAASDADGVDKNPELTASTSGSDFTVHQDGTATHNRTGLMWMRCSLGQHWNGSSCSGNARSYIWQQALTAAKAIDFAGYNDWRLPEKSELASIIEVRCCSTSINSTVFPDTPAEWFWSSSATAHYSGVAWGVGFNNGYVGSSNKGASYHARLVRSGQ